MSDKIFVDTNILIYRSFGEIPKKQIAHRLLKDHKGSTCISVQVLNEFINACTKKKYFNSEQKLEKTIIFFIRNFFVLPLETEIVLQANEIRRLYSYSFYDSLIIATALEQDCKILYSEDLHHGQTIKRKLKIVNPFI